MYVKSLWDSIWAPLALSPTIIFSFYFSTSYIISKPPIFIFSHRYYMYHRFFFLCWMCVYTMRCHNKKVLDAFAAYGIYEAAEKKLVGWTFLFISFFFFDSVYIHYSFPFFFIIFLDIFEKPVTYQVFYWSKYWGKRKEKFHFEKRWDEKKSDR